MSEYWKSTPKYWCKHCSTHVKDTPFERKQHESTGKHQGNLKRFLRDIQNSHERDERDKQKAKAEVDRLNKQFGGSQSTAQVSVPSTRQSSSSLFPQASVADRQRQMAQLAEMGIQIPDEQRTDLGLAAGWRVVSQRIVDDGEAPVGESLSRGVHKRKFERQEEEDKEGESGETVARRGWGSTTKRYPSEDEQDLNALLATHNIKKIEDSPLQPQVSATESKKEVKKEVQEVSDQPLAETVEKEEEASESELTYIPRAQPVPVFKKRKPKGVPR